MRMVEYHRNIQISRRDSKNKRNHLEITARAGIKGIVRVAVRVRRIRK